MGFFNFLNIRNDNFQAIPLWAGKDGAILDGVIHKQRLVYLNGSRPRFLTENMNVSDKGTPGVVCNRIASNGASLWVATNTLVYQSIDDGLTWGPGVSCSSGSFSAMKQLIAVPASNTLLAVRQAATEGINRVSLDGGSTWQDTVGATFGCPVSDIKKTTIYEPSRGWVNVGKLGAEASIAYSANGVNWTQSVLPGIETQGLSAVIYYNNQLYMGAANSGRVYRCVWGETNVNNFVPVVSASAEITALAATDRTIVNFVIFQGELFMIQGNTDIAAYKLVNGEFLPVSVNKASSTTGCRVALALGNRLFVSGGTDWYTTLQNYGLN